MDFYEEKLKKFILENDIFAQHLRFGQSCHSVGEAAKAANANIDEIVKSICLIDANNLIVAIVKGENKVSITKVGQALKIEKPRIATRDEVLNKTGYPAGGTPSFGYSAVFLIDPKVMEKEIIYSGGGSENSLIKISSRELQKANNGHVVEIRK
jgi:Cys-tRNA(Pro)/Cys-tRNA(Cys) deacylase